MGLKFHSILLELKPSFGSKRCRAEVEIDAVKPCRNIKQNAYRNFLLAYASMQLSTAADLASDLSFSWVCDCCVAKWLASTRERYLVHVAAAAGTRCWEYVAGGNEEPRWFADICNPSQLV